MALRAISLCAGVGGIDLGLRLTDPGIRTVCYVEREAFCASVLAARMEDGSLDQAPVWDDVATFDGNPWRGAVDIITAGFPCQPVSLAGNRKGLDDHRFIWDDIARIIDEVGPRYVFLENVPGILTADGGAFLDRVLSTLVLLGFDCEWDLFSAEETGAPHRRQRWFCLAVADRGRPQVITQLDRQPESATTDRHTQGRHAHGRNQPVADAGYGLVSQPGRGSQGRNGARPAGTVSQLEHPVVQRLERQQQDRPAPRPVERGHPDVADTEDRHDRHARRAEAQYAESGSVRIYPPARNDDAGWAAMPPCLEPAVCRDADGLAAGLDPALFAYRNDRLRAVGNGVVPLTAALAWLELMERMQR